MSILKQIMPGATEANIEKYLPVFEKYKNEYEVNTPLREAGFWAQVSVESNQLGRIEESLYYKTPERIMKTWPSRFKTVADAMPYVKNPEKLANKVYTGRMGNTEPGSGYKHRGAGLIQVTGHDNQLQYSKDTYGDDRIVKDPTLLLQPEDAVRSALWFWKSRGLNKYADAKDIVGMSKKVNGGTTGLADREWHYNEALKAYKI